MKALIPAAGLGTRYLPRSKAVPKKFIPIGAHPVLHYVVAKGKAAGGSEIDIILPESKEAIRSYFSCDSSLLTMLESKEKREIMAIWEQLMESDKQPQKKPHRLFS